MEIERDYEPEPLSVRNVRQFVEKGLHDTANDSHDVVLVASELASNAVTHARTAFTVRLTADHQIVRLEVSDRSAFIPLVEEIGESQRGLRIVQAIATRWGIDPAPTGKTVWAEFALATDVHGQSH